MLKETHRSWKATPLARLQLFIKNKQSPCQLVQNSTLFKAGISQRGNFHTQKGCGDSFVIYFLMTDGPLGHGFSHCIRLLGMGTSGGVPRDLIQRIS